MFQRRFGLVRTLAEGPAARNFSPVKANVRWLSSGREVQRGAAKKGPPFGHFQTRPGVYF